MFKPFMCFSPVNVGQTLEWVVEFFFCLFSPQHTTAHRSFPLPFSLFSLAGSYSSTFILLSFSLMYFPISCEGYAVEISSDFFCSCSCTLTQHIILLKECVWAFRFNIITTIFWDCWTRILTGGNISPPTVGCWYHYDLHVYVLDKCLYSFGKLSVM